MTLRERIETQGKLYKMHWTEGHGIEACHVEIVVCPSHSETICSKVPSAYGTLHIGEGSCQYCEAL